MRPQFMIAAVASGSGKTTLTMGLLRLLQRRGMAVQPYKCGPDYIDPQFHSLAAGQVSVNLDLWLASSAHVRSIYNKYAKEADVCVVEGVMGLFDGYERMNGSCAEVASLLGFPVVLVVSARSAAYSVAATLYGFRHFCPEVQIAGVIFNGVKSSSHLAFLKEACADAGVVYLGALPWCESLTVPSRHLGLSLESRAVMDAWIDEAASVVAEHVDVETLLRVTQKESCEGSFPNPVSWKIPFLHPDIQGTDQPKCVAVARDEAFSFIYSENLAMLERLGSVVFFSPLHDAELPDADWIYLPGGYPELYAGQLADNIPMRKSIRDYAENGGCIFAECGGLIYLSQSVAVKSDATDGMHVCPMAGVLPFRATMAGARLHLGYRRMEWQGREWRGHEFHYSSLENPDALPSEAQQFSARGKAVDTPLYRYKNVIAGYTHWYFADDALSGEKNKHDER